MMEVARMGMSAVAEAAACRAAVAFAMIRSTSSETNWLQITEQVAASPEAFCSTKVHQLAEADGEAFGGLGRSCGLCGCGGFGRGGGLAAGGQRQDHQDSADQSKDLFHFFFLQITVFGFFPQRQRNCTACHLCSLVSVKANTR